MQKKLDEIFDRCTRIIMSNPHSEKVSLLRKDAIELLIMAVYFEEKFNKESEK